MRKSIFLLVLICCVTVMFSACNWTKKPVIKLNLDNVKVELEYGEDLDLSNMVVSVKKSGEVKILVLGDASEEDTYQIDYGGFDKNIVGRYIITISSEGCESANFAVVVKDKVQTMEVKGSPRTDYILNETFDSGDAYLQLTYASELKENVSFTNEAVTIDTYDFSTSGNKDITIHYGEKTCVIPVVVYDVQLTDVLLTAPSKVQYNLNESLDLAGGKISIEYSNTPSGCPASLIPQEIPLTDQRISISGFSSSTVGEKQITVAYRGFERSFTINVSYSTDQNQYIYSLKVNNEAIDIANTDYIEANSNTEEFTVDIKVTDDYVVVLSGEKIEPTYELVNSIRVATYQKVIEYKYYKQTGYELKIFVYNAQGYQATGNDNELVYSKKLGFYRHSYIENLVINGISFERVDNDTYAPVNGVYMPFVRYNDATATITYVDDGLPEATYRLQCRNNSTSGIFSSAFQQSNTLIIDLYEEYDDGCEYDSWVVQSFYAVFECDPAMFDYFFDEIKISGATSSGVTTISNQSLRTGIIDVPSTTKKIYIDLGALSGTYTISMFVDDKARNYVGGTDVNWYYIDETGFTAFQMQLYGDSHYYSIFFLVKVANSGVEFADEYISSLALAGVEAEFSSFENKYILHIPNGYAVDDSFFRVVFEDAYVNYYFTITNDYLSRKVLKIYNPSNALVTSCYISLIKFEVADYDTSFLAMYTKIDSVNNVMEINTLEFDSSRNVTITNCTPSTVIQFTMIADYRTFTVESNCIGLADKTDKNFTGFIVNSNASQYYIRVIVKSTGGVSQTYTINVVFA